MDKKETLFIKTQDRYTMETLISEGFELIDYTGGIWTFVHKPNHIASFDEKKVTYSNKLCF